ncbi:hypothetical protein Tco_0368378 [Tanacetum coccineum]
METIHVQFDELIELMAPVQLSTGPVPTFLTPGQISSRLVPNPVPAAPYVPPINKELEILFQPMFDEYLELTRVERPVSPAPAVLVSVTSAGTPSSTTIDQDAPSLSHSPSSLALQYPSLYQGVAAESTLMEDNPFPPVDNDPFVNVFAPEPSSEVSSSGDLSSRSTCVDTMADMNIPANDATAVAPLTRTDDQILLLSKWVPIGKSNCVLDVHKPERNPIFPIAMVLLKNTNFFRAFMASSTIPAIYIQQFWDTMCFNSSTRLYSCLLDEQWFNLHKYILRDALDISPANDNNPFVTPPLSDTVIEYVNMLGYPSTLRNVSAMSVNALYQPWRAILSMINMCLIGKTAGYDRPRHPMLQIL